jgi:hypothetical protein
MTDYTEDMVLGVGSRSQGALRLQTLEEDDAADERASRQSEAALIEGQAPLKGGPDGSQYDFEQMLEQGDGVKDDVDTGGIQLRNTHIRPGQVEIGGYDMTTGDRLRSTFDDKNGEIEKGVHELSQSNTDSVQGAPLEDSAPLSRIANGILYEGGTYQDFAESVPKQWSDAHKRMAWRAAVGSKTRTDMAAAIDAYGSEDGGRVPGDVDVADIEGDGSTGTISFNATFTDEDLQQDGDWLTSARTVYHAFEGEDFNGSDEQLHNEALQMMSDFNYNTWTMARDTSRVLSGQDDLKRAFYRMMVMYDNKEVTFQDFVNGLQAVGTDPLSYTSLGLGKVAATVGQQVAKRAMSAQLKKMIGAGVAGAGAGAGFMAYDDFNRQLVEREAGAREKVSGAQIAGAAAIGAAGGAVMGPTFVAGAEAVGKYGGRMIAKARQNLANAPKAPAYGSRRAQYGRIGIEQPDAIRATHERIGGQVYSGNVLDAPAPPFQPDPNVVGSPNKQVGRYLQDVAMRAMDGKPMDKFDLETQAYLVDVLSREAKAEMQRNGNGFE